MVPPSSTSLSPDFCKLFNISKVITEKPGGQKRVFFVKIKKQICVLKIFKKFGNRERRELDIYEKYKHIEDIPKIIKIKDYEDETIIIETFIDGNNLYDIRKNYFNDYKKISQLIIDLVNILTIFWEDNIVHRDLKPHNIIIKRNGRPSVIDFGIARDLEEDSITGTGQTQPRSWQYSAPEQVLNQKRSISYRTDYFSLGILAYHLYYDKLPFGQKRVTVENNIKNKNLTFKCNKNDLLKPFYSETLEYSIARRPRNSAELLKLLKI